jgi:sterol 3beta-glucosyltransferase
VTGYWRAAPPATWTPDARLAAFLDAGRAPVYVGFGSMVYRGDRHRLARELAEPLLERGERVLVVRGWALGDDELRGTSDVFFLDDYEGPWHSWLFERVKAVIHHGGPGTVGAALHAGRPQLCCPFAMDQPFWARRAWGLGVGPEPLPMRSWSVPAWRQRVSRLLSDDAIQEKAIVIAGRLSAEDGVARAVEAIHDLAEGRLPGARRSD